MKSTVRFLATLALGLAIGSSALAATSSSSHQLVLL